MENCPNEEEPFWINPCGLEDEPDYNSCVDDPPLDRKVIKEVLKHSLVNVKVALDDAKHLKEYLVNLFIFSLFSILFLKALSIINDTLCLETWLEIYNSKFSSSSHTFLQLSF